ncbi:MAG: family transcriptional regulator [Bacteroidetes bacterium]|nr:family transcriptional regulator [Bacteroidota bacterium]
MLIQHNFLRIVRKRTHLTQVDIASILKISDFANVSRWEQGQKTPNVEMLLGYHLLFDIPIESLFDRQKHELKRAIIPRIQDRIRYLKTLDSDPKVQNRIDYLGSILSRITL